MLQSYAQLTILATRPPSVLSHLELSSLSVYNYLAGLSIEPDNITVRNFSASSTKSGVTLLSIKKYLVKPLLYSFHSTVSG